MEETSMCKVENQECLWVKTVSLVLRLFEHEELAPGEFKKKRNEFQTHGQNNIAGQSKESTKGI